MSAPDADPRVRRGAELQAGYSPALTAAVREGPAALAPGFADQIVAAFGDVYGRPGLDERSRVLVTVVALAATGQHGPLEAYLRLAPDVGLSRQAAIEALVQLHLYLGVPASLAALATARRAYDLP